MTITLLSSIHRYIGLSTDVLPTTNIPPGSEIYIYDRGITLIFNGSAWINKAVESIPWTHAKIHEGKTFVHSARHTITSGNSLYFLLINPAGNYAHLKWSVKADTSPLEVYGFKNPITTANGTEVPVGNTNDSSSIVANMKIYESPTITSNGTQMEYDLIVGSGVGAGASGGNTDSIVKEWVLAPNTHYLMRTINNAVGTAIIAHKLYWYEV